MALGLADHPALDLRVIEPGPLPWPDNTFGGVLINDQAQVISTHRRPISGLFACGEMVGGIFHYNYPGGTGLMSGAVFGRRAGASAARAAAEAGEPGGGKIGFKRG